MSAVCTEYDCKVTCLVLYAGMLNQGEKGSCERYCVRCSSCPAIFPSQTTLEHAAWIGNHMVQWSRQSELCRSVSGAADRMAAGRIPIGIVPRDPKADVSTQLGSMSRSIAIFPFQVR
jgi:hypothetical protein